MSVQNWINGHLMELEMKDLVVLLRLFTPENNEEHCVVISSDLLPLCSVSGSMKDHKEVQITSSE